MSKTFIIAQRRSSTPAPCNLGRAHIRDCYSRLKQSSSGLADATDFIDVCTTASLAENGLIGRCSRSQPCNTGTHVRSYGAQTGLDQSARDDDVVAHMDPLSGNPSRWARSETIDARGAAHLPTTGQMCMRRRRSSCDGVGGNEAGLVGQHYGVHAVADSELGEEAIDVGLDCCLAEDEVLGDFVVG